MKRFGGRVGVSAAAEQRGECHNKVVPTVSWACPANGPLIEQAAAFDDQRVASVVVRRDKPRVATSCDDTIDPSGISIATTGRCSTLL